MERLGPITSTSTARQAPVAEKPRAKTVMELTPAEYAQAKAEIVRWCTPSQTHVIDPRMRLALTRILPEV